MIDKRSKREKAQSIVRVGATRNDGAVFGQYVRAVDLMIQSIAEKEFPVDAICYPLCYMMRHALELGYKENIRYLKEFSGSEPDASLMKRGHDLSKLHHELQRQFNKAASIVDIDGASNAAFAERMEKAERAISQLAPSGASAFRYAKYGEEQFVLRFDATLDIVILKNLFDTTVGMLSHTADVIAPFTDRWKILKARPELAVVPFNVLELSGEGQVLRDFLNQRYGTSSGPHWITPEGNILSMLEIGSDVYVVDSVERIV